MVVVGALVRRDRLLLCHRHPGRAWYPDCWDLPGGHVEPGEDPRAALSRELREELGVAATVTGEPVWTLVDDEVDLATWLVRDWVGEPAVVETDEHDDLGWFTHAEALALDLADPRYPQLLEVLMG